MFRVECISLATRKTVPIPASTVLCLGNFDGVHIAHRALIRTALRLREETNPTAVCGAFCFREPSSDFLFSPPPPHLCTLEEKLDRFAAEGLEIVLLAEFPDFREERAEDFVAFLKEICHCVGAVCGFNYRFGKDGRGNGALLTREMQPHRVCVHEPVTADGGVVSSTRVRGLLFDGNAKGAAALLGTPYSVTSPVLHGKGLGHTVGFPTLNQTFPDGMLIPRHGVYITECHFDGKTYRSLSNVGIRPTFEDGTAVNLETHLPGFSGDLYGKEVTVFFLDYLRPEHKFASIDELTAQMTRDLSSLDQS